MMEFDLHALTEPGKQMVELAEKHAADFATRADAHDREATYPFENVAAMKESGFVAAAVPKAFGGLGVTSIHDCVVAMNRLGRGEGSTPLAFNMHLFRTLSTARDLRDAIVSRNDARQQRLEEMLKKIGAGELMISVANAERGADIRTSRTQATKVEGGWLLNGAKIFATGSPAADVLAVRARYENEAGEHRLGAAIAPLGRDGVEIMNNWNGLGMRASGSHDVVFTDYFVSDEEFNDIGEFGAYNAPVVLGASGATLGLASIFLGIAETAHQIAVSTIQERGVADDSMNQVTMAENEIELAAARALLSRTAQFFDHFYQTDVAAGDVTGTAHPSGSASRIDMFELIKNAACAKKFVMDKSVVIVDRAMTVLGGGGYLATSPLARLYRDVRAGPFMNPWSTNQAIAMIGKVALGLDPN